MVLTTVYNFQNYWVSGLCPSSGVLEIRKYDVSRTGSRSILRKSYPQSLDPPHLRTKTDPASEMLHFPASRIQDGHSPKTQ
jgi:hypothetical protein